MNVLIVGLGALGTVFGCLLKRDGHRVCALEREALVSLLPEREVQISGIWGEHKAVLDRIAASGDELDQEVFDLVIVTVKSFDTVEAVSRVRKSINPATRVILAQNGFGNYEGVLPVLNRDQLLVARVIFGSETLGPAFSKVTVIADDVILGSPENAVSINEVEKLASVVSRAGIPCRASTEVMKYLWDKIIYNSALNSLGAILEVNYGKLAELAETRIIMDQVVHEIFAVLEAAGVELLWADASSYLENFYRQLIPVTADHHPSMLQDIQRGRPTEIDVLNGAICQLGQKNLVPTPINLMVTRLVKAKEQIADLRSRRD